jgi:hypothetical protein
VRPHCRFHADGDEPTDVIDLSQWRRLDHTGRLDVVGNPDPLIVVSGAAAQGEEVASPQQLEQSGVT